jgi:hypothetical protein
MINLKNKPEGATYNAKHHGGGWYKKVGESWYFFSEHSCLWVLSKNKLSWHSVHCIQLEPDWTIHNNTLPLSELSDEQRGLLFNHWCNGGARESETSSGFIELPSKAVMWIESVVYRAKQKTERELFVEAASKSSRKCSTSFSEDQLLSDMFDAGFKAPKVGE